MKILVCEDDPLVRTVVSMILASVGHQVETSNDGQEGLEKIRNHPGAFEVLITDNRMPRLTGIELVESLREMNIPVKVIMASTFAAPLDEELQHRLRLDGLLKKPFKMTDLLKSVEALGH